MPQSLSNVVLHIVFSTKNRSPLISEELLPNLHAYMAGTLNGMGCACLIVGGVVDHVHVAIQFPRTTTIARVVSELKTSSTKYLKSQYHLANFAWQSGYGVFSVSESDVPALKSYIRNQKEHHATMDFQSEFRQLLQDHNLEFDERYVWD